MPERRYAEMLLKKFSRSLERKRDGKTAEKFRFDVNVVKVTGAFASATSLRVLWTRGSKVQVTNGAAVQKDAAQFDSHLTQVATLYRDSKNNYETKDYAFKLQTVGPDGSLKKSTIGKANLDLAQFASIGGTERSVVIPMKATHPQSAKGLQLYLKVTSVALKGAAVDDGFSTVSGLSTVTSTSHRTASIEQDLSGNVIASMATVCEGETVGTLTVSASTDFCKSLSHSSGNSTADSTVVNDGHKPTVVAEASTHLQLRVEELEAQLKAQFVEREELQRLVESQKRQSESDIAFVKRELELERLQKAELENQLVREVDESSGQVDLEDALQAAIAPYELRYQTLATEYQEVVQQMNAEIDVLHEELLISKDKTAKLGNLLEVSERARESLNTEKRALEMSLIGSCTEHVDMDKERKELREELTHVDEVMQELIQTKMDYAELSERQTITRRELCKMKEKNLQLASKVTKMETYLYYQRNGRS